MRSCEEYEFLAGVLLDGALEEAERRELEAHLARCPACRAYLADLRAIRDAVRSLDVPAPAGFTGRVMDAVRAAGPEKKKAAPLGRWRRWAAVAACCAAALVGVWAAVPDPAEDGAVQMAGNVAAGRTDGAGSPAEDSAPEDGNEIGTCALENGPALPGPVEDATDTAGADKFSYYNTARNGRYAAVLTTGSAAARDWVARRLGTEWTAGREYALTAEEYAELRAALVEAGEDFTESAGSGEDGGYLLVAQ